MAPGGQQVHEQGKAAHRHAPEILDDDPSKRALLRREQLTGEDERCQPVSLQAYMQAYMQAYIQPYMQTYMQEYMQACMQIYMQAYICRYNMPAYK